MTGNVLRDYLTDLSYLNWTSAKMLSVVPLMKGGGGLKQGRWFSTKRATVPKTTYDGTPGDVGLLVFHWNTSLVSLGF